MVKPPTDPNPVASTGGVANSQGQAIFTGDWNTLINDIYPHALDSLVNHNAQYGTATVNIPSGTGTGFLNITFPSSFGGPIPEVIVWLRQNVISGNVQPQHLVVPVLTSGMSEYRWEPYPTTEAELFGLTLHRVRLQLLNQAANLGVRLSGWITSNNDATGTLDLQYSLDGGSTWSADIFGGTSPALPLSGVFAFAVASPIPAAALVDALWRVTGLSGANTVGLGINFSSIRLDFTYPLITNIVQVGRDAVTTTGARLRVGINFAALSSLNFTVGWLAFVP